MPHRALLVVICGLVATGLASAQKSYRLVRTEVAKHVAGKQPETFVHQGGLKALELVTEDPGFTSRGNLNVNPPDLITSDQTTFTMTARLECTWTLKSTMPNINVGLNFIGVPKTIGKGDPGPWNSPGSHTLQVDVTLKTSFASNAFIGKSTEKGKSYRKFSLGGHTGVGQTLSGFVMTYVYEEEAAEKPGSVVVVGPVGEVEISPGGDDSKMRRLRSGDRVNEFDRLITGMDSKVQLLFPDGTVVEVGELTDMKVACYMDAGNAVQTRLWLRGGEVSASVNKSSERPSDFVVKTPTATLGVRGTKFTVRHNKIGETTTFRVTHGKVHITPENKKLKPLTLGPGQKIDVSKKKVGPIGRL